MQSSPDGRQGLLLRRLLLSSTNPVFVVDINAALREAFKVAAEAHPHTQLLEAGPLFPVPPYYNNCAVYSCLCCWYVP